MLRSGKICVFAAALQMALGSGCSTWSVSALPTEPPATRIPLDSVVLEAAFVRIPADSAGSRLWQDVDESILTAEQRRHLRANGLRAGILGAQIPEPLQSQLDEQQTLQLADQRDFASNALTSSQKTITSRSGERSELVIVPEIDDGTAVLLNDEGRIRGLSFQAGQALLAVRSYPSGDGTVRLELTPEIQHGPVKQQWVPGNGSFLYDVGRDAHVFEGLRFEARLSPGQTLVLSSTEHAKGVGALCFASGQQRLVILIRLSQTQYDDLFAPQQRREPLATPLD